jgi:hypothetical protein
LAKADLGGTDGISPNANPPTATIPNNVYAELFPDISGIRN